MKAKGERKENLGFGCQTEITLYGNCHVTNLCGSLEIFPSKLSEEVKLIRSPVYSQFSIVSVVAEGMRVALETCFHLFPNKL